MVTQEIVETREGINIPPEEMQILSSVALKLRHEFVVPFLQEFYPEFKVDFENPASYISIYAQYDVQIKVGDKNVEFPGLVPLDIYKVRDSVDHPIALLRQLNDAMLQEEFSHFHKNERHYLAAANIAQVLSDPEHPVIVIVDNRPKKSHRLLTMTRNQRVDMFRNELLQGESVKGRNIVIDNDKADTSTVRMYLNNDAWKGGSVQKFKNEAVFIDPIYSINLPLYIDGRCFILQIGLRRPPPYVNGEYFSRLEKQREEAQKILNSAWNEAKKSLPPVYQTDTSRFIIELPIVREVVAVSRGFVELLLDLLTREQLSEETRKTLIQIAREALKAIDSQTQHAEHIMEGKIGLPKAEDQKKVISAEDADDWDIGGIGEGSLFDYSLDKSDK